MAVTTVFKMLFKGIIVYALLFTIEGVQLKKDVAAAILGQDNDSVEQAKIQVEQYMRSYCHVELNQPNIKAIIAEIVRIANQTKTGEATEIPAGLLESVNMAAPAPASIHVPLLPPAAAPAPTSARRTAGKIY